MARKQALTSAVVTVLALAMLNISPTGGLFICPWCYKSTQTRLLDCVYVELVSRPQLIAMPIQEIDNIKWKVASDSDSMIGMPYADKKVKMDGIFMKTIADAIKRNNYQNNQLVINVISDLAGKCYSSVTGYDPNVVTQDIKKMINEDIKQSTAPLVKDSNPLPNSRMPYSANQNQQNNFQPSQPQNQPPLIPANPVAPPLFPGDATNNFPLQTQPPVNDNGYKNNPALQSNMPLKNGPFNPPVSPPANSFNNPSAVNNGPFNPSASPPANSFNNPSSANNAPFNPPVSPPVYPSNNPSFVNNGAGPSENSPPKDYKGQRQAGLDFLRNQAPSDSSPSSPLKNNDKSQSNRDSLDNAALTSTSSPKISSPSQDSKPSTADSLDNSNETTLSPITDVSNKKMIETEKSDDKEPCDEKFKNALYEKLINDNRFYSFYGKLPVSTTKPAVPRIMSRVFKEYGIEQHYAEFSTLWKFESKTLNKESTAKDWDEVISKICKIIFSRNNLLNKDCEETGREIADYFLDELPGEPPASSTGNPNQNDGNNKTSTKSNADSSVQKANPSLNSTINAPAENNFNSDNSTNPENLSFPELNSKLANTFKKNESTDQDSGTVPFSELLSTFETQQYLETLHRAAENCKSPSGFNFKKFFGTMSNVTELIQKNHPDWSRDKCEKEMYSATVAVMTKELQDALTSSNNNAKGQSTSDQPDSAGDSIDTQNSNSGAQPLIPNDDKVSSDDSIPTNYDPGSAPQPQQDSTKYGNYPDRPGPGNIPPSGNQPGPGNWNAGLAQPSNFAPGPVNSNHGDFANRNLQNPPLPANQPYEPNHGNTFSHPSTQNYPSQGYPAIPPANMNPEPHSGLQPSPVIPNAGLQQSPNFAPNSGVMNPPNGNFRGNQFQAENRSLNAGPSGPALLNDNSQNFQPQFHRDYDRGVPATGPVIQNDNNKQQFYPNYNSRFPANGPVNTQNRQPSFQ